MSNGPDELQNPKGLVDCGARDFTFRRNVADTELNTFRADLTDGSYNEFMVTYLAHVA